MQPRPRPELDECGQPSRHGGGTGERLHGGGGPVARLRSTGRLQRRSVLDRRSESSTPQFLGVGIPTYFGWLFQYVKESEADGTYSMYCTAEDPSSGADAFSAPVLVNVVN